MDIYCTFYWILITGYLLLDTYYWILITGYLKRTVPTSNFTSRKPLAHPKTGETMIFLIKA
jgi:hypothetical protein